MEHYFYNKMKASNRNDQYASLFQINHSFRLSDLMKVSYLPCRVLTIIQTIAHASVNCHSHELGLDMVKSSLH